MPRFQSRPRAGLHLFACCALLVLAAHQSDAVRPKVLGFRDPNTNYLYSLRSINATTRQDANSTPRSLIRVSRVKLDERRQPVGQPESIQTLKFTPTLVDFDLHCSDKHCYLVTVTSRTRRNVELFAWQRTQFDSSAVRDSFAKPAAVKLIGINDGFYIAIAQEQLQLSPYRYSLAASDDEEPTRFMGCALLKFMKGDEHNVKYHQFIRLSFNPRHVNYFTTVSSNNATDPKYVVRPTQSHHLVFSSDSNWADPEAGSENSRSFIWSPLNDYFWPYRLPRGGELVQSRPGTQELRFPEVSQPAALTNYSQYPSRAQQDYAGAVEMCFYQLQRLLADRDLETRRMIDSSKSVWRATDKGNPYAQAALTGLTNISAQVVVHGNVVVTGSVLDNPQISLIGGNRSPQARQTTSLSAQQVGGLVKSHSPAIVENKLKRALFKLNYMREKIGHAVPADLFSAGRVSAFMNQVRLFGPIEADEVIFSEVANSDVRLNGVPFRQLEHELVSLSGTQRIGARVVFTGKVVADRLEIHGLINGNYHLRDAIDISSNRLQVIDAASHAMQTPGWASVEFRSVSAPEIVFSHNATLNSIRLDDFITRDNRTQLVVGRKSFKRLSMSKLDLAHPGVSLNDLNISRISRDAIRLRPDRAGKLLQLVSGYHGFTFMRPVFVEKLTINGKINQHINLTSLIYDSIKANSYQVQQIIGQKNFLNGLKVNRLNTEGALNNVQVNQIFNLNRLPPLPEQQRADNITAYGGPHNTLITGRFNFRMPVQVAGSVHANLVNGVDLAARAVRRGTPSQKRSGPQLVRGRKTFYRPLRVIKDIRLIDLQQASRLAGNATPISYPLVNGIDMRKVSSGLARQKLQPPPIFVQNLEIDGNLEIPAQSDRGASVFGNQSVCPLDLIRSRVVLAGAEDQIIDTPVQVNTLRARNLFVAAGALNGLNFPADFVLRTAGPVTTVEHIYGVKTIQHMIVSPASQIPSNFEQVTRQTGRQSPGVVFGHESSINDVPYAELQSFIGNEHNSNSTGEKIFKTMNVHGNIYSRRINGYEWPNDILLRSVSSTRASSSAPFTHKRIYSHLIFTNTSQLRVEGQLVLRGPIQLNGLMNGVNLTEFSRQSATYGDKDLYSVGRPIRNKIFLGGISVKNGIRSDGLINGVNFEEMKQRVVTIGPSSVPTYIPGPKIFTDVSFEAPLRMNYLNGIPINNYLNLIRFEPDGVTLRIPSKKVITGALRINRNLYVHGLINGVDFTELKARAISLAPSEQELVFNKTLIVEGDVFMDNLWIDERNGTVDGVKLKNLLRVGPQGNDEFAITDPTVVRLADPFGRLLRVSGTLMDCQVSCDARPALPLAGNWRNYTATMRSFQQAQEYGPSQQPITIPAQSVMSFTSRPTIFNQNSFALTRTTPPYSLASSYQPPFRPTPRPAPIAAKMVSARMLQLGNRQPVSVRYEQRKAPSRRPRLPALYPIVDNQLETLRKQIVSVNLVRLSREQSLIVGFIDVPNSDIANYKLPEADLSHNDHTNSYPSSYLQLDQIDFKFKPTTYHLSVGVSTNRLNQNVTSVHASLGVSNSRELTLLTKLPVEAPNSAKFFDIPSKLTLFLLISQDRFLNSGLCYANDMSSSTDRYNYGARNNDESRFSRVESGIHVYLFHPLLNSSSFNSAYFDLHQTLDLIGIDAFERFTYKDSSYVLAISREFGRIHLLLLRGYTGFQQVSHIDAPMIESVIILQSNNETPVLVIRQTSGSHRIMEAVVI